MPPAVLFLKNRLVIAAADRSHFARVALLVALHLAAFGVLLWSEADWAARAAFLLAWGFLNCFWLVLLRRPATAAALSLAMVAVLILLSQFKQNVTMMTANFVDVMLIDKDTFSFLLTIIPGLAWKVALGAVLAAVAVLLLWRLEPFRIRRGLAALGCAASLAALVALSLLVPLDREDEFFSYQFVSKFTRSAAVAAVELMTKGVFEADAKAATHLDTTPDEACPAAEKLPHIVMVFDESSFDATMLPATQAPPNYRDRFRSSDGKVRSFVVEGAGGPSWFTEYNVLAGLSVRSYGRFAESVTRIATGRLQRGLPFALRRCGYKTYSLYSWFGAFVGARNFQTSAGIQNFLDAEQLNARDIDTDAAFYGKATEVLARERGKGPLFVFVYLAANHFPWTFRYRPDLATDWRNLGNPPEIEEYLRRQEMSVRDLAQFKLRLAREFPGEKFLFVRFGDHQPLFARNYIEPGLDEPGIANRIRHLDPRYFTTYYAIEGLNFQPRDLSSALDTLDAPYLPLVVLESAGVPLDASFKEQKRILQRCNGMFYLCAQGAEARRFNRLLIDAGLLKF
jgi:phosphoglycerol transferase MdoB-like AlkP superfamily enzyme